MKRKFVKWVTWTTLLHMGMVMAQSGALVESVKDAIEDHYVQTENIRAVKASLDRYAISRQDSNKSNAEIADELTELLQQHDKHFTVRALGDNKLSVNPKESWFTRLNRSNHGFSEVKILQGNVGYINFWGFDNVSDSARSKVASLMAFVADADALILDLRENGGSSAQMVQLISSYLLDGRVHLNSFYSRATNATQHFHTYANIDGSDLELMPIYIVIGPKTFSAAEEFAYNLQQLKRAVVIGQPSKGGANPWQWYGLNDEFQIGIPVAKAINPVSKTNWEAMGVQPHYMVDTASAVDLAYLLALRDVKEHGVDDYHAAEIDEQLTLLQQSSGAVIKASLNQSE